MAMRPQTKADLIAEDDKFWKNSTITISLFLLVFMGFASTSTIAFKAEATILGLALIVAALLAFIVLCYSIATEAKYATTRNHELLDH